ncbi:hypothetical protein V8F06_007077 [Rhypophila decipiens]
MRCDGTVRKRDEGILGGKRQKPTRCWSLSTAVKPVSVPFCFDLYASNTGCVSKILGQSLSVITKIIWREAWSSSIIQHKDLEMGMGMQGWSNGHPICLTGWWRTQVEKCGQPRQLAKEGRGRGWLRITMLSMTGCEGISGRVLDTHYGASVPECLITEHCSLLSSGIGWEKACVLLRMKGRCVEMACPLIWRENILVSRSREFGAVMGFRYRTVRARGIVVMMDS